MSSLDSRDLPGPHLLVRILLHGSILPEKRRQLLSTTEERLVELLTIYGEALSIRGSPNVQK